MKWNTLFFLLIALMQTPSIAQVGHYTCSGTQNQRYDLEIFTNKQVKPLKSGGDVDRGAGSLTNGKPKDLCADLINLDDQIGKTFCNQSFSFKKSTKVDNLWNLTVSSEKIKLFCSPKQKNDGPTFPPPQLLQLEGTLEHVFAIGGETTGMGINTNDGRSIEITGATNKISEGLRAIILTGQSSQKVLLKGYFILHRGVERGSYPVFNVTSFTELK